MKICAPHKKLVEAGFSSKDAHIVRHLWKLKSIHDVIGYLEDWDEKFPKTLRWIRQCFTAPGMAEIKRAAVDELFETHGVEWLGVYQQSGRLGGCDIFYCNAGDTYTTTIIFIADNLRVGCWGDLVEQGRVKQV